jgi:hypothetical protein
MHGTIRQHVVARYCPFLRGLPCLKSSLACFPALRSSFSDMALKRDVAAVNELLASLEEESISKLKLDDGSVTFELHSDDHGPVAFSVLVVDPSAYPKSSVLITSENVELPFLDQLSEKLSASGCKLTKALRLLGTKLGIDLDWCVGG